MQYGIPFPLRGRFRAADLGFYQRDNKNPSYQERRQTMEVSMNKFMAESEKRRDENSILIKEICSSIDAAIRNQGASIKALKIQIGQISKALADLGASASVMPLTNFTNLGFGDLDPTKLTVELADRILKYPKGVALVGIGKFVFPIDFIVLDMSEDVKVPLILETPFLSITHAKIDVFEIEITLMVGIENITFKSIKPTSNLIKKVYMLSLGERMKFDLEARLMGEALVIDISQDPSFEDFIKLNDLYKHIELRRNQVEDFSPTIGDGEWIIWMATEIKTWEMLFLESHSARLHVWK
nr:hypothetical protein [Tanacetum cinerariifolium]